MYFKYVIVLLFFFIYGIVEANSDYGPFDSGSLKIDSTNNDDSSPINGRLFFDYGVNFYLDSPEKLKPDLFPPKGINLGYEYNIQLGKYFSINPGLGLGLENYMFQKNVNLRPDDDSLNIVVDDTSGINYKKSKLSLNYFDIPLEITFRSSKKDKAFKMAIGGKIGVLFNSHSKVKLKKNDGSRVKIKNHDDFYIKQFRYGVTTRIGFGNFIIFGYYGLNGLFEEGKGPELNPLTVGISVIPFD